MFVLWRGTSVYFRDDAGPASENRARAGDYMNW